MPINAIFEGPAFEHVLEMVDRRVGALALDGHRPRFRHERAGQAGRLFLVGAELVIVVVGGDLLPRIGPLVRTVGTRLDVLESPSPRRRLRRTNDRLGSERGCRRCKRGPTGRADKRPAIHVQPSVGDVGTRDPRRLDQHDPACTPPRETRIGPRTRSRTVWAVTMRINSSRFIR